MDDIIGKYGSDSHRGRVASQLNELLGSLGGSFANDTCDEAARHVTEDARMQLYRNIQTLSCDRRAQMLDWLSKHCVDALEYGQDGDVAICIHALSRRLFFRVDTLVRHWLVSDEWSPLLAS